MRQLALFPPVRPADWPCCEHGSPLLSGCPACRQFRRDAVERFKAAVARGEYDAEGYTPTERKRKG